MAMNERIGMPDFNFKPSQIRRRKVLEIKRYDRVRVAVNSSRENMMVGYVG